MKHTRLGRNLLVIAAGAALGLLPAMSASAAGTQVYSGKGWKALADIHSLSGDGTGYTIQFASADAKTKLTPAAKQAAAQLTSVTGIKFTLSTTIKASTEACATTPRHVLTLGAKYRPLDGQAGMSGGWNCYNTADRSAWGGWAWIDTEYWTEPNWFSTDATVNASKIKNAVVHEIGHTIGLDHPNKDLDGDGTVASFECDLTTDKYLPVMCSPNGGYTAAADGGKFTSLETPGLKQLAANWTLPAPAAKKGPETVAPGAGAGVGVEMGAFGGSAS
ncbi:M12 family metallo-peptidase [Streptomyces sp. NBC_00370]|uniref:M12 family metallo-peptidase n=1 Tax=Streptomyces sp. NBC_00370 TaxID=2975728 RepID=UPI002E27705A